MIDAHSLLLFAHIVLMGYWLGGDLGVYLAADRVADARLSRAERLRFLKLAMQLDMAPRTALIAMLPTGFHMAHDYGYVTLSNAALAGLWAGALAWLGLAWLVYLREGTAGGEAMRRIDLGVRYIVLVALLVLAAVSLVAGAPVTPPWLALKLLLFAGVVALGLMLRVTVAKWVVGFRRLAADGSTPGVEAMIAGPRRVAARQALLLWALVLVLGFLGVTQPTFG